MATTIIKEQDDQGLDKSFDSTGTEKWSDLTDAMQ